MKNKKSSKKIIVISVAAVLVAATVLGVAFSGSGGVTMPVQTAALSKGTLRSVVSTSGTVQSSNSVNVYAAPQTTAYPVESIAVEVGDHVEAGQALFTLQAGTLKQNIEKARLTLAASEASAKLSLQSSQQKYNDQKANMEKGLNSAVTNAQTALKNAQTAYETAKKNLSADTNASLVQSQNNLDSARLAFQRASSDYSAAKKEHTSEYRDFVQTYQDAQRAYNVANNALKMLPSNASQAERDKLQKNLDEAAEARDAALKDVTGYENGVMIGDGSGRTLKSLRQSYEDTAARYESAQKQMDMDASNANTGLGDLSKKVTDAQNAYDAAVVSAEQSLTYARQSVEQSKLAADNRAQRADLANMEAQLLDCAVTAHAAGTVTAVNAVEGGPAAGVLLVLEDTGSLEIKVRVKEYDIASIKAGMSCVVRADALEGQEFTGMVKSVAPAAVKNAAGAAGATGTVEFDAIVQVTQAGTPLRIGMNAKADIVMLESKGVYSVPYDAIVRDAKGGASILVAKEAGTGFIAESLPVTTGMETDTAIEISGEGLVDGLLVLSDAAAAVAGMPVNPGQAADKQNGAMLIG